MKWFGQIFRKDRIFLDYAGGEGNPSAIHKEGREARRRLEEARAKMARMLGCQARDIIFTSGSTESNNLAILGSVPMWTPSVHMPHIIIGEGEHPSVAEPAKEIRKRGGEMTLTREPLEHIKESASLISLAYAESETGRVNDIPRLARSLHALRQKSGKKRPYLHTDATQAYEYLEVDINKVPADLITLGRVLVVRPNVELRPLILGGGQERGLRSGTEKVEEIEQFVSEMEEVVGNKEKVVERLMRIKKIFLSGLHEIPGVVVNTPKESLPNIVSVSFPGKLHEFLAVELDERGVAVSTGSSCDSDKDEPDKEALRFSFGEKTRERDVREAIRILKEILV